MSSSLPPFLDASSWMVQMRWLMGAGANAEALPRRVRRATGASLMVDALLMMIEIYGLVFREPAATTWCRLAAGVALVG